MGKQLSKNKQKNRSKKTQRNMKKVKLTKKQKRRTNKHYKKRRTNRKKYGVKRGGANQDDWRLLAANADLHRAAADDAATARARAAMPDSPGQAQTVVKDGAIISFGTLNTNLPEHLLYLYKLNEVIKVHLPLLIESAQFAIKYNANKEKNGQIQQIKVNKIVTSMMDDLKPHIRFHKYIQHFARLPPGGGGALRGQALDLITEFRTDSVGDFTKQTLLHALSLGFKSVHTFKTLILTYFGQPTIDYIKEIKQQQDPPLAINQLDEAIIFGDIYIIILDKVATKINMLGDVNYNTEDLSTFFYELIHDTIIGKKQENQTSLNRDYVLPYLKLRSIEFVQIKGPEGTDIDIVCKEFANIIMEMYTVKRIALLSENTIDTVLNKLVEPFVTTMKTYCSIPTFHVNISTVRKLSDRITHGASSTLSRFSHSAFKALSALSPFQSASNYKQATDILKDAMVPELSSIRNYVEERVETAEDILEKAIGVKDKHISPPIKQNQVFKKHTQIHNDAISINFYADFRVVFESLERFVFSLWNNKYTEDEMKERISEIQVKIEDIIAKGIEEEKQASIYEQQVAKAVAEQPATQEWMTSSNFNIDPDKGYRSDEGKHTSSAQRHLRYSVRDPDKITVEKFLKAIKNNDAQFVQTVVEKASDNTRVAQRFVQQISDSQESYKVAVDFLETVHRNIADVSKLLEKFNVILEEHMHKKRLRVATNAATNAATKATAKRQKK